MDQVNYVNEYAPLAKKLKRRKRTVSVLAIIAIIVALCVVGEQEMVVMDQVIYHRDALNPALSILIFFLIFVAYIIALSFVLSPMVQAMDVECDPEKHLYLTSELENPKNVAPHFATDFTFLGNFNAALNYANQMIATNKTHYVLSGLFNKARCEFFLNDFDAMKSTAAQFEAALSNSKKMGKKNKAVYEKIHAVINLMIAIADNDKEKVALCKDIKPWQNSKAQECVINYFKGLAATVTEEKEEAIFRFMSVKEIGPKTVFAKMAEEQLEKLR